jgi:hypothetical protein
MDNALICEETILFHGQNLLSPRLLKNKGILVAYSMKE